MSGVRGCRRVADALTARLRHLGMSQQQLAARSGVSAATIRKLERGRVARYRRQTLAAVSVGLGWPPDGLDRIHGGESPDSLGSPVQASPEETSITRIAQLLAGLPRPQQRAVALLVEALAEGDDTGGGT